MGTKVFFCFVFKWDFALIQKLFFFFWFFVLGGGGGFGGGELGGSWFRSMIDHENHPPSPHSPTSLHFPATQNKGQKSVFDPVLCAVRGCITLDQNLKRSKEIVRQTGRPAMLTAIVSTETPVSVGVVDSKKAKLY